MQRYVWLLPALFAAIGLLALGHPGDEYGLLLLGTISGIWSFPLADAGSPQRGGVVLILAGAIVMAAIGWGHDRMRTPPWRLAAYALAAAGLALWLLLSGQDSYERAIAKNGSLLAYVLCALNLGLQLGSLFALPASAITSSRSRA
jgi:hypothetical protein